ncbi:MAG: hypothetical protein U1C70_07045, partial [Sediminibacterium sp.]|uniref:hypothetical protein n=1 Tax=Sediminibacterium sp. TaxID=1917865 RepID=UPI002ABA8C11
MLMIFAMVSTAHAQRFGDNFGDHRATDTLRMNNFRIVNAQGIAIGTARILNNNIALQIDGLDKALLLPRVSDTLAIPNNNAVNGMLLYSLADDKFYYRQAGIWKPFGSSDGNGVVSFNGQVGAINMNGDGTTITVTNTSGNDWVVAAKNTIALWNANRLMGRQISGTVPTNGQVYVYNTITQVWEPRSIGNLTAPTINGQRSDSLVTTLNGVLRKIASSDILFVADTAAMLSGYVRENRFLDSLAAIRASIKRIDTLANLVVTGTISGGTFSGTLSNTAQASITNLANLQNITATGNIRANTLGGTLITGAQPNITSVGTLTNLSVANNISAGGTISANTLSGTLSSGPQPNITALGPLTNLSVSGIIEGGMFSGTLSPALVASLQNTGTFTNITVTNFIYGNQISGTLTTAVQPNITSVGNLSGLTVTGTAQAATMSATTGNFTTANITNLAGLTNLSVTNTIQSATVSATTGNFTNINATGTITGGTFSGTINQGSANTITSLTNLTTLSTT